MLKRFPRSKSNDQGEAKCTGGGIHVDGMKLKLTCSYNMNLYERASDLRLMLDSVRVINILLIIITGIIKPFHN